MHAVDPSVFGVQGHPSECRVVSLPATDLMSFAYGWQSDQEFWMFAGFDWFGLQLFRFATLRIVAVWETSATLWNRPWHGSLAMDFQN
jgi:hypothetical protein